jgi:hypothetical protein
MAVWTIAAQEGTGGDRIAADLAAAAGVPLLDRRTLALLARELDPDDLEIDNVEEIERRYGGRLRTFGLSLAITTGLAGSAALHELQSRRRLPDLGRAVVAEVTRRSCVILAPGAFAAMPEGSGAISVRLHAPLAYRIAAYQREHLADPAHAEKAVKQDDRSKRAWVRWLYQADIDDAGRFTLALDTSRFSPARVVEILLAAGGIQAPVLATD